jgi:hypothetical protein
MSRALTMNGQQVPAYANPAELFDSYLALAGHTRSIAMAAIRTRSLAARSILAHAATRDLSLDQLVAAARDGATHLRSSDSVNGWALAHLARTVALQDILPDDRSNGVALYELTLRLFGTDRISRYHQGLHAQLVFHSGDHRRAAALLDIYRRMSDEVRAYLELDLSNPFTSTEKKDSGRWLSRFRQLLPEPAPALTADEDALPFERLTCADRKTDGDERISVVVTAFKPGPGLATAVRSLIGQSWTNLEILIVDDGSPPDYDPVLKACLDLDDRVRLVKQAVNAGTYAARNAGLDATSGSFVTFQDSDDWSHPRRLEQQVKPLLRDPSIVATVSDGLRVTDNLIVTHTPGRDPYAVVPSSLMLRKSAVLQRVGYFDTARREADSEYLGRIQAAFGAEALERLRAIYSLIRFTPNSLSRTDIRAGWMHPARLAYKSAYHLWHQQIANGEAEPYVPRDPVVRPFAAPSYIRGGATSGRRPDVVFVGDWRRSAGVQRSMVDEIDALTRQGTRVGVLHVESFRFLPERHVPLCRPVQELINTGKVVQVFGLEEVDTNLVIVASPSVLQFAPSEPSRISTKRLVIRTSRAPFGRDGTDYYYVPRECARVAKEIFSVDPMWCPQGSTTRKHIEAELTPSELLPFDLSGTIDIAKLRVDRARVRSDLPIIGTHFTNSRGTLPADPETLLQVYPDSTAVEVRMMGETGTLPEVLGAHHLPANWLVYDFDEVSVRSFLNQIDFFPHFPPPSAAEAFSRPALEALASGCVVILPHRLSLIFGDAALYCDPPEVWETVQRYYSHRELYVEQCRRARQWVRRNYSEDVYVKLVSDLIG